MENEENSRKYWAFISYSHADKAWADWFHKALETYPIPRDLVGKPSPAGTPIPRRFFPVFRDREELPVATDLGAVISRALANSRFLIVICPAPRPHPSPPGTHYLLRPPLHQRHHRRLPSSQPINRHHRLRPENYSNR